MSTIHHSHSRSHASSRAHKPQAAAHAKQAQASNPQAHGSAPAHGSHDKLSLSPEALGHLGEKFSAVAAPVAEAIGEGMHKFGEMAERAGSALRADEWGGSLGKFAGEHGSKLKVAGQVASVGMTAANLAGTWGPHDHGNMHHKIERTGEILGEAVGATLGVGAGGAGGAAAGTLVAPGPGTGVGMLAGGAAGGLAGGKLGGMWGKDLGGMVADRFAPEARGHCVDIKH